MENLIAIAADSGFVAPARALLNSIERNWRPFDPSFSYLVLDCGLSPADQAAIERTTQNGVIFCPCTFDENQSSALQSDSHLSLATFARFELFRLISELTAQRILYIDSDALVLENCRDIWQIEGAFAARWRTDIFLSGEYLPGFDTVLAEADANDPFLPILTDPQARPFNAGVLLLHRDPIQATIYRSLQEVTSLYSKYFMNADQSALNLVALRLGIVHSLPYKYNVPQRELLKSEATNILHFVGKYKPWLPGFVPRTEQDAELDTLRRRLWNEYAPDTQGEDGVS